MAVWTIEGSKLVKPVVCPVCGDAILNRAAGWCRVAITDCSITPGTWPVYSFCLKRTTCWCVTCDEGWCDDHDPRR